MTTLREEINTELAKAMVWTLKNKQIDVNLPDKIVSIFEKRIDSLQPNYDKIMSLDTSRGQLEYIEGFTDVIKIVKEGDVEMSLREEISNLLDSDDAYNSYETIDLDYCVNNILKLIEKRIDKVEKDYWKSLGPYLRGLPMKDTFPKEMDALDKVRKEITKGKKTKKKKQ